MKKFNIFTSLLISLSLVFGVLPVIAENAFNFEENEGYYKSICTNSTVAKENKSVCIEYAQWLEQRVENAQDNIKKYKGEISKYKDDLEKQIEIAKGYEIKIYQIQDEIISLNKSIETLERNIAKIESEILAREAEIDEKDQIIIERMRKTQSDLRFGHEIDFLFKARDIATLIASASVINDILDFESVQIEEINKLIDQQKADKDSIILQQEAMKLNITEAKYKKEEVEFLKREVEEVIENYKKTMDELAALQSQASADASTIKKQMANIYDALEEVQTSTGFVRPIPSSIGFISARVWSYPPPWSATHLGYDYAAPIGTPIRAAANGVVLASYDNCPTWGGYPNWCGSPGLAGGGNQVFLLVSVQNKLYGVIYLHMQSKTTLARSQTVTAGQIIGRMGSSGNSTGSHAHVEVIYLGNRTINDYINGWSGSLTFDIGMSLAHRCDYNGYSAPCRMDPGKAFGYN